MPLKNKRLTPQERVFAERYAATGDAGYAATKAGYGSPAARASQNLNNPGIVAEVRRISMARLTNEALPLAVERHVDILRDPGTTGPTLTKAIQLAYQHALRGTEDEDERPIEELTAPELARRAERARLRVEALDREAAERARPVIEGEATETLAGGVFD